MAESVGKKTSMGLDENVEGALCYVLGFVTGIVFLVMEKDSKFVKFHAWQSILIFFTLWILNMIISALLGAILPWSMFGLVTGLVSLVSLVGLIIWIVLILKAYQGEKYKLPVIGDIAEKQSQAGI
jgi:uncharacterized membrane protein